MTKTTEATQPTMPEVETPAPTTPAQPQTASIQTGGTTSLTELRARAQTDVALPPNTRAGFESAGSFELMQRGARLLASSTMVPKEYQGNLPNCVIALEMAQRLGASPLMIMQNLYLVHGKPAWSSQFLIACVNQCGRFSALQYEWQGAEGEDKWGCRAVAVELRSGLRVQGPLVTFGHARKEGWVDKAGSKWKTLPELMITYRAATFFARTNAPELTMGLQTREEMDDIQTAQVSPGVYAAAEIRPDPVEAEVGL
jgi:hypothetical protein